MEYWERVQEQRKIEADIIAYRRKRFEELMEMSDIGLLTRLEALAQMEEEENG